jgi:hypothetical protein
LKYVDAERICNQKWHSAWTALTVKEKFENYIIGISDDAVLNRGEFGLYQSKAKEAPTPEAPKAQPASGKTQFERLRKNRTACRKRMQ